MLTKNNNCQKHRKKFIVILNTKKNIITRRKNDLLRNLNCRGFMITHCVYYTCILTQVI